MRSSLAQRCDGHQLNDASVNDPIEVLVAAMQREISFRGAEVSGAPTSHVRCGNANLVPCYAGFPEEIIMAAPIDSTASRAPAHTIWVEMTTRIVTRNLHFRSGQEETALKSIVDLFKTTRALMTQYPDATAFLGLAGNMLETIRPYTARWHSMVKADGRFFNPALRRQFRAELHSLQRGLQQFVEQFASLSGH